MLFNIIPLIVISLSLGFILFLLFRKLPEAAEQAQIQKQVNRVEAQHHPKKSIKKRLAGAFSSLPKAGAGTLSFIGKKLSFIGKSVRGGITFMQQKRKEAASRLTAKVSQQSRKSEAGSQMGHAEPEIEAPKERGGLFSRKKKEEEIDIQAKSTEELFKLSEDASEKKDYKLAEKMYIELVARDAKSARAYIGLGKTYFDEDNLKDAKSAFDQAILCDSSQADAYYYVGCILYKQKVFKRALNAFNQAVLLDGKDSKKWYDLGRVYRSLSQNKKALKSFLEAANLDSKDQRYLKALVSSYKKVGKIEQAKRVADKLEKIKNETVEKETTEKQTVEVK